MISSNFYPTEVLYSAYTDIRLSAGPLYLSIPGTIMKSEPYMQHEAKAGCPGRPIAVFMSHNCVYLLRFL